MINDYQKKGNYCNITTSKYFIYNLQYKRTFSVKANDIEYLIIIKTEKMVFLQKKAGILRAALKKFDLFEPINL